MDKSKTFQNKNDLLYCEICKEKYCISLENIIEVRINTNNKPRLLIDEEGYTCSFCVCVLLCFCILMIILSFTIFYSSKKNIHFQGNYTNYTE